MAGMDYKEGSPNPTKNGGDGLTDHYVAITSISMNFSFTNGNVQLTGGFLGYANPGSSTAAAGLSSKNKFSFGPKGVASNTNNRILSTLRVK